MATKFEPLPEPRTPSLNVLLTQFEIAEEMDEEKQNDECRIKVGRALRARRHV